MNELQLTKESIANEGIEIKLTQADVIDALVDEQMEIINNRFNSIEKEYKDILQFFKDERQKIVMKHFEEVKKKLPKYLIVDENPDFCFKAIESNGKELKMLTILKHSTTGKTISFSVRDYGTINTNILLQANFDVKIKCSDFDIHPTRGSFKFVHRDSPATIKRIKEHNLKVEQFLKDFPEEINPSKISKDIKNRFTKEILKTSSPDFKKKLKAGFGITL